MVTYFLVRGLHPYPDFPLRDYKHMNYTTPSFCCITCLHMDLAFPPFPCMGDAGLHLSIEEEHFLSLWGRV